MAFASYPSAVVYNQPGAAKARDAVQHLIWGDYVRPLGERNDGWVKVRARRETGWMREDLLQQQRILEMCFVDVGQGDGCLIVTPDDKWIVVDAGVSDNMFRFLRWRFGRFASEITFESAVITHPDKDHYEGFRPLFEHQNVRFGNVYHNGIVDRVADSPFGPTVKEGGRKYLTGLVRDKASLKAITDDDAKVGRKHYPGLLKTAADGGRVGDVRMLSADDGSMPGYGPQKALSIRVLGPVPEGDSGEPRRLRSFGSDGKTKNGHSVVLQLQYGVVKILIGGDLNTPAELYLMQHYTQLDPTPRDVSEHERLVRAARAVLGSDIAKACHHGSGDFSETFLEAVDASATVVSSGDNEPYCHPRPDALGALGKYGRGRRPLIFSTELARSPSENTMAPSRFRATIEALLRALNDAETDEKKEKIEKHLDTAWGKLERSIAVYGMINLRTDGRNVLMAQKLERPRSNADKWDIHLFEAGPDGMLCYVADD